MVVDEFMDMLVKLAGEANSLEHFKQLANEKWDYEIDGVMTSYLEDAFRRRQAGRPCAENYFENYFGISNFMWRYRHLEDIYVMMQNPIDRICENCNKVFQFNFIGSGRYCSRACAKEYYYTHEKTESDIERITREWLEENNVCFIPQYRIEYEDTYTIVDFFIKPNMCYYADGDYYHTDEESKDRAFRQIRGLTKDGYVVIRVSGTDILNGEMPEEVLKYAETVEQY